MKNIVSMAAIVLGLGACGGVYSTLEKDAGLGGERDSPDSFESSTCDGVGQNLEPYTYSVEGEGFDDEEGERVLVQTEIGLVHQNRVCVARSLTMIEDGQFSAVLQNHTDDAVYPKVLIFIDRDENGLLDKEKEPFFASWHSLNSESTVVPEDFEKGSAE